MEITKYDSKNVLFFAFLVMELVEYHFSFIILRYDLKKYYPDLKDKAAAGETDDSTDQLVTEADEPVAPYVERYSERYAIKGQFV